MPGVDRRRCGKMSTGVMGRGLGVVDDGSLGMALGAAVADVETRLAAILAGRAAARAAMADTLRGRTLAGAGLAMTGRGLYGAVTADGALAVVRMASSTGGDA